MRFEPYPSPLKPPPGFYFRQSIFVQLVGIIDRFIRGNDDKVVYRVFIKFDRAVFCYEQVVYFLCAQTGKCFIAVDWFGTENFQIPCFRRIGELFAVFGIGNDVVGSFLSQRIFS